MKDYYDFLLYPSKKDIKKTAILSEQIWLPKNPVKRQNGIAHD